ncbi:hypothetical protein Emin_1171 [Elusimicrobium minutum Pei191]|uniref:Lipoprotein n=1 Tax=Elusimicrobium minutum (strain Pei191) TaxID=445932 RepID=B2KDX6_ELUMP|nr:hypothetical protein [Elusimicrobium minutum]ACC98722.1 hypothetical protein Emin_1171 [Elusimicrobium minutum Pei191]
MKKFLISVLVLKKIITLILILFIMGCMGIFVSEPDWIQIGPMFEPNKGKIDIYADQSEIKRPYGNLGVARIKGVVQKRDDLKDALHTLTKYAAHKGADGIYIGQSPEEGKGTVVLVGYAIKYVDNLSEQDKQAIDEYKIMGVLQE